MAALERVFFVECVFFQGNAGCPQISTSRNLRGIHPSLGQGSQARQRSERKDERQRQEGAESPRWSVVAF